MKFNKCFLLLTIITSLLLCACQQNPDRNQVVSKNDGAFDARAAQTATASSAEESRMTSVIYEDSFQSTDKSVDFNFNIQEGVTAENVPIVEVTPHYLTAEDAKRIAEVLFEGATFYESQPRFGVVYSKSEIQDKLQKWSSYANEEAIKELYGEEYNDNILSVIKMFIEEYTSRLETAPQENLNVPCKWIYQKSLSYIYTAEELKSMESDLNNDSEEIAASLCHNGIEYQYSVATRDKEDFKLNYISVRLDYGLSPYDIDTRILLAERCRLNEPTDEQISFAKKQVEEWLNKMELGQWIIDQCYVQETPYGNATEYRIYIKAVPSFSGAAAIRRPQLSNLKSENAYASNYYLTEAEFSLSPAGDLLSLQLLSPVDVVAVVNENPAVLSTDELIGIAKNHFQLSDIFAYGFGSVMENLGLEFSCYVDITRMEYGLSRVKVPNTDESYYYVPSIALYGNIEYSIQDTGEVCFSNEDTTLLILNAIDGSVIPLSNE